MVGAFEILHTIMVLLRFWARVFNSAISTAEQVKSATLIQRTAGIKSCLTSAFSLDQHLWIKGGKKEAVKEEAGYCSVVSS